MKLVSANDKGHTIVQACSNCSVKNDYHNDYECEKRAMLRYDFEYMIREYNEEKCR